MLAPSSPDALGRERSRDLRLVVFEQLGDLMVHVDDIVSASAIITQLDTLSSRADTQVLRGMTRSAASLRLFPLRRRCRESAHSTTVPRCTESSLITGLAMIRNVRPPTRKLTRKVLRDSPAT